MENRTKSLSLSRIEEKFRDLYKTFGDDCLSDAEGYDCYGKPCACMVCRHEEYFCIDHHQGPCTACNGADEDRTSDFCLPPEEDEN